MLLRRLLTKQRVLVLLAAVATGAATSQWWMDVIQQDWALVMERTPEPEGVEATPKPHDHTHTVSTPVPAATPPGAPATDSVPPPSPSDTGSIISGPLAKAMTIVPPPPPPLAVPPTPAPEIRKKKRTELRLVGITRGRHRAVMIDIKGDQQLYHVQDTIPTWGTVVAIIGSTIQIKTEDGLETLTYRPTAADFDASPDAGDPAPDATPAPAANAPTTPPAP